MIMPIQFPSDSQVIAEEGARFRELAPEGRMESIRGLLAAGTQMMRRSPKSAFLREYSLQLELLAREAIKGFLTRHAG